MVRQTKNGYGFPQVTFPVTCDSETGTDCLKN